jgi:hypothetical protein
MTPTRPQYPDSEPTSLSPQCCVRSGEARNINFIVSGLTRSGLEPTNYHTRGEHANHDTTHDTERRYTHTKKQKKTITNKHNNNNNNKQTQQ